MFFMEMVYIQFEVPKVKSQKIKERLIKTLIIEFIASIFKMITPAANPDFDTKIEQVKYWMIECDNESGIPEREIGLDENKYVIVKMPYNNNYGYWIDNNLLLNDFKKEFKTSFISKVLFESKWESFPNTKQQL